MNRSLRSLRSIKLPSALSEQPSRDARSRIEKAQRYKASKEQGTEQPATSTNSETSQAPSELRYEQVKCTEDIESLAPELQASLSKQGSLEISVQTASALPESRRPGDTEETWDIAQQIAHERNILASDVPEHDIIARMSSSSVSDPRQQESSLEATWNKGIHLLQQKVDEAESVAQAASPSSLESSAPVFDPSVESVQRIETVPMHRDQAAPSTSENNTNSALSDELSSYKRRKGVEVDEAIEERVMVLNEEANAAIDAGQIKRAREVLDKAVALCPGKVEAGAQSRLLLGSVLEMLGEEKLAMEAYEGACAAKGKTARKASQLLLGLTQALPFLNADKMEPATIGVEAYRSVFDSLAGEDRPYIPTEDEKQQDERNATVQSLVSLILLVGAPAAALGLLKLVA